MVYKFDRKAVFASGIPGFPRLWFVVETLDLLAVHLEVAEEDWVGPFGQPLR